MRLNNRSKTPIIRFFFTLATVIIVIGSIMAFFHISNIPVLGALSSYGLIVFGLFLHAILYLRGRPIFEYDSDGEALNFKNYSTISFLKKESRDEFPKYKLLSYEVVNAILFKRLYIYISSKKSHSITLKYDISYLSTKEIRDLKSSLNRVLKQNKENQNSQENN